MTDPVIPKVKSVEPLIPPIVNLYSVLPSLIIVGIEELIFVNSTLDPVPTACGIATVYTTRSRPLNSVPPFVTVT